MADAKLTALTAASALAAADLFYVSQSAASRKATGTQLLALVGTAYVPLAGGTMTGPLTISTGATTALSADLSGYLRVGSVTTFEHKGLTAITGLLISSTSNFQFVRAYGFIDANAWASIGANSFGGATGVGMAATSALQWSTVHAAAGVVGVSLWMDAPATLAQRNGTTQQSFSVYNTESSSLTNYERLKLTGVAGTSVNITAESLGTGAANLDVVITPKGTGGVTIPAGLTATPGLKFAGTNAGFWYDSGAGLIGIRGYNAANPDVGIGNGVFRLKSSQSFGWSSGTDPTTTGTDTGMHRSAPGIVEVNNGVLGAWRDLKLRNLLNTEYHQMTEMTAPSAPAKKSVRIYAEDNGSGKTRLMALFNTGAAQQLAIEP